MKVVYIGLAIHIYVCVHTYIYIYIYAYTHNTRQSHIRMITITQHDDNNDTRPGPLAVSGRDLGGDLLGGVRRGLHLPRAPPLQQRHFSISMFVYMYINILAY